MKTWLARAAIVAVFGLAVGSGTAAELPTSARDAKSGFAAIIANVIGYAYRDVWLRTPSQTAPALATTGEIIREQRLDVVIAFGGFAVDAGGKADVVYDLVEIGPEGKEKVVGRDIEGLRETTPSPANMFLAKGIARFSVPPDEPAGEYRFIATVRDRVGGRELKIGSTVLVLAESGPLSVPFDLTAKQFGEWMLGYHTKPDPRRALAMLQWLAKQEHVHKPAVWPPLLGFYEMILRDNPWLIPQFSNALAPCQPGDPDCAPLLRVLGYAFRADAAFAARLPEQHREAFQTLQKQPWPDPADEILNGDQLDVLWGRFFGSGEFAPIQRLVSVLDYHVFRGQLDEFKKLDPKPKSAPPEVYKNVMFDAAVWSLRSNAQQSRLVHNYLAGIFSDPKTADAIKPFLGLAIGAKLKTSDGGEIDFSKDPPVKSPPPNK